LAQQRKARKVGRPKLPKGEAKGKIVQVRLTDDRYKAAAAKAKASKQTVLEWIRSMLNAAISSVRVFLQLSHTERSHAPRKTAMRARTRNCCYRTRGYCTANYNHALAIFLVRECNHVAHIAEYTLSSAMIPQFVGHIR
jgi:hypothetical protein